MSSLQRWDPFRGLVRAQRDLDRLFDSFFGRPLLRWEQEEGVRVPAVDLTETENEVVVTAELPGVERKDLDVEVLPEALTLKAEMSQESEQKEETYHRRERVWGRFERTLSLPAEVVADQVKAVFKDGVLEVRLPKTEQARAATPKKVNIE
ncbi:MAG: Hsp20/alpha crystallin family protein [Armatimonadota bacterium]|nr:MAG: Hsp20/alpha crystallin family protein [Armatimonadota bacterium]